MARFLLVLLLFFSVSTALHAQTEEELLELIDPDQFSESSYARLVEMIHDLQIENHLIPRDSIPDSLRHHRHPKHTLILSGNGTLPDNDSFQGNIRYDLRYTQANNAWRAGFVNDHYYASLARNRGWLRHVVAGHYRLSMGSGLICNQRFSLGKNLASTAFFQKPSSLSVHSSTLNDDFMQGIGLQLRPARHWELVPFLSIRKWEEIDGLMTHTGTRVRWLSERFEIGTNLLYTLLQHDYNRALRRYNQNWFRGHQLFQGSLNYEVRLFDLHLRGETALSSPNIGRTNGGWATVNALKYDGWDNWRITLFYRQYSNTYQQILGNSLSESSAMQGERGEMLQIEADISRHWTMQTSADWFHFTQPQYGIYQPSEGYELSGKFIYHSTRRLHDWQGSIHYRLKTKFKNNSQTEAATDIIPFYRHSIDGNLRWQSPCGLYLKAQAHCRLYYDALSSTFPKEGKTGISLSQSAGWNRDGSPWRIDLQGTWYRTDSYDSRVYLSEKNLLYGFSIPMLYGEGIRLSALLSYQMGRHLSLRAKYAHTEKLYSPYKNQLWAQAILKF